jgi:beta-glucanase (GH16 family)
MIILFQAGMLMSCKDNGTEKNPQLLFSEEITVSEDDPDGNVSIPVYLSGEPDQEVSFDYIMVDSTAVTGRDYGGVTSGKITFGRGQLTAEIPFKVLSDTTVKQDVYLNLRFSNPVNARLNKSSMKIRIFNVDFSKLVWFEGFDASVLNASYWNYETGGGGWGNNELQTYSSSASNVHIDSGYLHISALNPSANTYTSGRINTHGRKDFTYFRADIRARLPEGKGIWPAVWTLGTNYSQIGWPRCGEIDIMELLGQQPDVSYGAVHFDSGGHTSRTGNFTLTTGKFSTGFHIFSIIWTPNQLRWLVDNHEFFRLNRSEIQSFPFDLPQFFILNVAVGGNWPGSPDQTTVFPQHMFVDYIKVYQ